MAAKKTAPLAPEALAARQRAEQTSRQLEHKPGPPELLAPQELADAAPFYLVLREYIRQVKEARQAAGATLEDISARSGLAVETLSRLENGALTNPTWKTLGAYAAALGLRPRLVAEASPPERGGSTTGKKRSQEPSPSG
jgi:ribosome-binding protein aMBF1 (putative translation factor)